MNAPILRPSNFLYAPMFPLGPDNTTWKKLDIQGVSSFTCDGRNVLKIQPQALTDLAFLLCGCAGFIGHDSGISHLAAAVGLPGLLLWGDSLEEIWRPPSPKITILRHPAGLERLPLSDVIRHLDFCQLQTRTGVTP